ncbi:hypothetical protein L1987_78568 [Smallanthus sonchifolius]|uniref:Uncharacterized protein n=1 Tax=Smallanthus sonchifolius TaxID=185202 RepID=A0ACB8ZD10_9ASTR|nr:hypothetical protein L1987_78568 [Smallanthus sonchifolius]
MDSSSPEDQILKEFPGFIRVYKDGRYQKLSGTDIIPAGVDPSSGVQSKDVVISPLSVRLYIPKPNVILNISQLCQSNRSTPSPTHVSSKLNPRIVLILKTLINSANFLLRERR